jgi:hypothetical protein
MNVLRLLVLFLLALSRARGDALDRWELRNSTTNSALKAIAYANGTYVVAGVRELIINSTDGITWTSTNFGAHNSFYALARGNNRFVAVGHEFSDPCPAFVSFDGTNWVGYDMGIGGGIFNGITFGNGKFVAVAGSGIILTSPTGSNWTWQTSGTSQTLQGIGFGNGLFVAAGDRVILTSPDAINWSVQSHPEFGGSGYALIYTNGFFWLTCDYGIIRRSSDGFSWTNVVNLGSYDLRAITFGNGTYVAVGGGAPVYCMLLTSTNGIEWRQRIVWLQQFGTMYPNGIVFANNKFTVVCENGIIVESADVRIPSLVSESWGATNGTSVAVSGGVGYRYLLQGNTNLSNTNWTDLGRVTNDLPTVLFQDLSSTNLPQRFYRALGP